MATTFRIAGRYVAFVALDSKEGAETREIALVDARRGRRLGATALPASDATAPGRQFVTRRVSLIASGALSYLITAPRRDDPASRADEIGLIDSAGGRPLAVSPEYSITGMRLRTTRLTYMDKGVDQGVAVHPFSVSRQV